MYLSVSPNEPQFWSRCRGVKNRIGVKLRALALSAEDTRTHQLNPPVSSKEHDHSISNFRPEYHKRGQKRVNFENEAVSVMAQRVDYR